MEHVKLKNLSAGKAVAALSGRLDVSVSGEVEEKLMDAIEKENISHLILNMENVEYMSSSGFRVAIALLRRLKDKNGSLKICCVRPAVKRIFDVIELTSLFEIYNSEEEAVKTLPT
ncbi:MAG: STAS domain-containing protein [Leptospiraceae bacterium]|nr:STAS domain-containing protein [Leptospiraceae bacterium]MDW8305805.1 STAS domain-containing protein [Leptospiraceae bacterium]